MPLRICLRVLTGYRQRRGCQCPSARWPEYRRQHLCRDRTFVDGWHENRRRKLWGRVRAAQAFRAFSYDIFQHISEFGNQIGKTGLEIFQIKADVGKDTAHEGRIFAQRLCPGDKLRQDFLFDIQSNQINCKCVTGKVHEGYHDAAWALIPAIKTILKGKVVFTGHSMGGALALIAGAILKPDSIYTFNAPKAGNGTFAKSVRPFRFVSKYDLVQGYPSSAKHWAHAGAKISLESRGHAMDRIVEVL